MEFLIVIVLVGLIGGVLGYFAGKKHKPRKNHMSEGIFLGTVLGMLIAMVLDISPVYGMSIGILLGELAGMMIPKKEK